MSTDYYFKKWNSVLNHLERIALIDVDLQNAPDPDKRLCEAINKMNGMMSGYLSIYNDIMDCKHHCLQVQKNMYIHDIVKAVDGRIMEIKNQLNKLEGSNYRFPNNGLKAFVLTPHDIILNDIPEKIEVSEHVRILIEETKKKVLEDKERRAREEAEEEETGEEATVWWADENEAQKDKKEDVRAVYEVVKKLSEETLKRRRLLAVIGAQEKTRQITQENCQKRQKRERWYKELSGTLRPPAPLKTRERAAMLIQRVCREYFILKRKKGEDCKRDEILGLRMCRKPTKTAAQCNLQASAKRINLRKQYEQEYEKDCEEIKKSYMERRGPEIAEDYRDEIMGWFQMWYSKMKFFYDIPKENQGGSTLILNGTVPTPQEYQANFQTVMDKRKKNKDKPTNELKKQKMAAKHEAQMKHREEALKKKMEDKLLTKMMKNPNTHPGFKFPKSMEIDKLLSAIEKYHERWDELDKLNTMDIKEKYVKFIEVEKACFEVKMEIRPTVDEPMRNALKKLKAALEKDYEYMEKEMPEILIGNFPKITPKKKKHKPKEKKLMNIDEAMEHLVTKEIVKDYPRLTFDDLKGEPNYVGDDLRCNLKTAAPNVAETKTIWWEKCKEITRGLNKILLVGPIGSGRSTLVYIMATLNDAILFEVDLRMYADEELTAEAGLTADALASCARAAQPCIIYLKDVQRLYYAKKKTPTNEVKLNVSQLKKNLIKRLYKQLHKEDKVTIIGACADPWLTKGAQLLKKFPSVILMPNTTYNTTFEILRHWVLDNRMIPPDLDINTLAYTLQGYRFSYLVEALNAFLTAERIVKIAANGLDIKDVYDYIIQDVREKKTDYTKYLKWYSDKTTWGRMEKKHQKEQMEFRALAKKYEEAAKKKRKKPGGSEVSSLASSVAY